MELLCPAHELAHYYVFSRNDETELAEEAFEEVEDQLHEWEEKAEEYLNNYPGRDSYEVIDEKIKEHIERIESGQKTVTEAEINYLANAICVESASSDH